MRRLEKLSATGLAVRLAVAAAIVAFTLWVRLASGWAAARDIQTGVMVLTLLLVGLDRLCRERRHRRQPRQQPS